MIVTAPGGRRRRRKKRGGGASSRAASSSRLSSTAGGLSAATMDASQSQSRSSAAAPSRIEPEARPVSSAVQDIERMERDGDLSGMVDYVQRFQADPDTVKAAMQGITEYALKRPNTEDAAVGILTDGGVEATVGAMRLHIADESVGVMCAIALRTIADTAENRAAVVECGGISAIAEALRLHGDNGELVKWCAAALRNLVDPVHVANGVLSVEQADHHAQVIIAEGAIGALVNALHAVQKADAAQIAAGQRHKGSRRPGGGGEEEGEEDGEDFEEPDLPPMDDLPPSVDHFKAVRVLVLTMRTLAVGHVEVQAKMVVAGGLMVVEDAKRRYAGNKAAKDVIDSFSNLHGWLRSEQTLELVRAWRHSHFEAARQTLVRAAGCRRSTFVQLNNNTPYTLRRATCALKHGVWLVMPPEFIVPGEQGVPFGSGFQIGPQATEGAPTCPPLPFRQRSNVPEGWAGVGALSQLERAGDVVVHCRDEGDCGVHGVCRRGGPNGAAGGAPIVPLAPWIAL